MTMQAHGRVSVAMEDIPRCHACSHKASHPTGSLDLPQIAGTGSQPRARNMVHQLDEGQQDLPMAI